jgi:nucleotide-binding universal stress UspA family protein
MYNRILVPLDGSNLSAGVLPYVRCLAYALRTPVEILYVDDPTHRTAGAIQKQGAEYLGSIAASFSGIPSVTCTIEPGNPAGVIINMASAESGILTAMATHGYSGAARWLIGGVAEKVLRALTSDLLLVRPQEADGSGEVELKTVLVPLDCSQPAEKVLPTVSELANLLHLKIQLMHVTKHIYSGPPDAFLPVFSAIPNWKELWERDKAFANEYLTEKVTQLRAQGLGNVSSIVVEGGADGAAAEIIDLAQNISGGLIVMTSHGQTGIGRWLIGSVTERVVCHGTTPVLVAWRQK